MQARTAFVWTLVAQATCSVGLVLLTTYSVAADVKGLWPFLLVLELSLSVAQSLVVGYLFGNYAALPSHLYLFNTVLVIGRIFVRYLSVSTHPDWLSINEGSRELTFMEQIATSNVTQFAPFVIASVLLIILIAANKNHRCG